MKQVLDPFIVETLRDGLRAFVHTFQSVNLILVLPAWLCALEPLIDIKGIIPLQQPPVVAEDLEELNLLRLV